MTTNDVRPSSDGDAPDSLHPATFPVASSSGSLVGARDATVLAADEDEEARLVATLLDSANGVIWLVLVDERRDSGRTHSAGGGP
jgi:hypothetical protein